MTGVQAIQTALKSTAGFPASYLADLSDADLLIRPAPTANNIAWQMGHLIVGEVHLTKAILPDAKYPELPPGFPEQYTKDAATKDSGFLGKDAYLELFKKARQATIELAGTLKDADLDKPVTGRMASFAPTWGDMLLLVSNHVLMHAGQFTVVRRKLGKPVLF